MKLLLAKLTLGLFKQDLLESDKPTIDTLLASKVLLDEEDKYRLPSKYRAGTISNIQNGVAYLKVVGANVRDLLIEAENLMDAKEGDLVVAKRLLGKRGTPQAKVVEIVGREQSYSVGFLKVHANTKQLFDIRSEQASSVLLEENTLDNYVEGDVFQIDNHSNTIMKHLGNLKDPSVDEAIVLANFNKHDDFDEEVLKQAKSFKLKVEIEDYPTRTDLTHLPFCTIDPVTAKDFDDAIYFDAKNHKLYVAIADVSEYVEPFGAIDAEAIYRSFSIYLPHRSIPMLPRSLSETLCSLQSNVNRLAYTFEMNIDKESLEVTSSKVYEAIIHSKRRFSYEEIDQFLEGKLHAVDDKEREVFATILPLKKLTDALKVKRLKKGYNFRSPDLEMVLDENSEILHTQYAEETPSHALIEDCMLLANKEAASRFERGIFRIHEAPSPTKLQSLYTELSGVGIMVEPQESMRDTILFIQKEARERDLESEVDTLIIRSQMQAKYAPDNIGHFGLGFECYTHFTSPIRRYSDLIVHRLLKAMAKGDSVESSYVLRNIDALSIAISEKEREASNIEINFKQRKFARWANTHLNESFKAKVVTTDSGYEAEITDEVSGARVSLQIHRDVILFEELHVKIESVNLATAKITATINDILKV